MFSCTACLWRALRVLRADLVQRQNASFQNVTSVPTVASGFWSPSLRRPHSTFHSIRKGHHRRTFRQLENQIILPNKPRKTRINKVALRDAQARESNRSLILNREGHTAMQKAQYEIEYLRDPLKLAQAVLEKLRAGESVEALMLIRASEKVRGGMTGKGDNIVSWNHLMDWLMHQGDVEGARKIYNEMKKRGRRPDSHTYTVMLRGYAQYATTKPQVAVREAMKIWNSLLNKDSKVEPNNFHTNSMILVCARAGDMDQLWTVTGSLPDRGPGSADRSTYTTVLHALQADAVRKAAELGAARQGKTQDELRDELQAIFQQTITDGKKLWADVMKLWKTGSVVLDEQVVAAMGRLLMISLNRREWEDVLDLVEKTMGIRNMLSQRRRQSSSSEVAESSKMNGGPVSSDLKDNKDTIVDPMFSTISGYQKDAAKATSSEEMNLSNALTETPSNILKRSTSLGDSNPSIYALPGNNTLSLLVETAVLLKSPAIGKAYWELLTAPDGLYKVKPDAQNLTAYLRLLRISRASRQAVELLQADYPEPIAEKFFKRGTFVLAMSTCSRDKNNPHSFDNADVVLDLMQEKLQDGGLDAKVLWMYIELGIATTPGILNPKEVQQRGLQREQFVPDLQKNNLMRMMSRVRNEVANIRRLLIDKVDTADEEEIARRGQKKKQLRRYVDKAGGASQATLEDLAMVIKSLLGACDRVIAVASLEDGKWVRFTGNVAENDWKKFVEDVKEQKRHLSSLLYRMIGPPKVMLKRAEAASLNYASNRQTSIEDEPDEEDELGSVDDGEIEKSVPLKRKLHRAVSSGYPDQERPTKVLTLAQMRAKNERKRIERTQAATRALYPPGTLKPRVRMSAQDRWSEKRKEARARERGRKLGTIETWRETSQGEEHDPRPESHPLAPQSRLEQRAWGHDFQGMAEREGKGKADFVEL